MWYKHIWNIFQIRSCAKVDDSKKKADEDSGKAKDVELNYV